MRAVVALLIAGCGRLGFESTDASAIGSTCRPEQCNGADDDCDGLVDEGCPCTPFDVRVTAGINDGPGLVWTGDAYFVTAGGTTTDLVRIAADGTQQRTPIGALQLDPGQDTLAWTGSRVAAVYAQSNAVVLHTFDAAGVAAAPVSLGLGATAHVTWDRDRLVVSLVRSPATTIMREVAVDGTPLAEDVTIEGFSARSIAATTGYRVMFGGDAAGQAAVAIVPRAGGVPRVMAYGTAVGGYLHVAANGDGAIASSRGTTTNSFRVLDGNGNFASELADLPASADGAFWYAAVVPADRGYRAIGMTMPTTHTLYSCDLASDGSMVGAFSTWLTYFGNPWSWNSAVVTATREATAFPHGDGNGSLVRFVQRCR